MFGLGLDLTPLETGKYEASCDLKEIKKSERLFFKIIRLLFQRPGDDFFFPDFGCNLENLKINRSPLTIALITERIYKIKNWLKEYDKYIVEKEKEAILKDLKIRSITFFNNTVLIELAVETEAGIFEISIKI
ncbi:MAG: hypothetical protein QXI58_01835 [Candidatus Micrarchaeia archaeon]